MNLQHVVTADFDDHVRKWVEEESRQKETDVSWWDLYGKHQHLRERPQYRKYQISVSTSPMNYNLELLQEKDKPQQVFSEWFNNRQAKNPITTTISWEKKRSASYTWMQEESLKIGAELSVKANIPAIVDIGASFRTELDFRGRNTEVKTETDTFKIKYDLTIDPQTAVRADWIITEKEVEVPYDLDVYIEGYAAVWFEEKVNDHWLWFYGLSEMAGGPFKEKRGGLEFKTTGIFKGARGVHSVVEVSEYPILLKAGEKHRDADKSSIYAGIAPRKVTRIPMPLPSDVQHGDEE